MKYMNYIEYEYMKYKILFQTLPLKSITNQFTSMNKY